MDIDCSRIKEVYIKYTPLIDKDERFYAIPGYIDYAFSTYCRVFRRAKGYSYTIIYPKYRFKPGHGMVMAYKLIGEAGNKREITIAELIARVFLPGQHDIYIYNPKIGLDEGINAHNEQIVSRKWRVNDLYCLNKEQYTQFIGQKINGNAAKNPDKQYLLRFVNRFEPKKMDIRQYIRENLHGNLLQRGKNSKYYRNNQKGYDNTIIADSILYNPDRFIEFIMGELYDYPERLTVDKDLLTFGEGNLYDYDTILVVPFHINSYFTASAKPKNLCYSIMKVKKKYFVKIWINGKYHTKSISSYDEALQIARRQKAAEIRRMIEAERKKGLPEKILGIMGQWADRCERGQIGIWEPSPEVYQRETAKTAPSAATAEPQATI